MALIKCEDCGKEISDKASACIHCGCPIENTMDVIEEDNESGNEENMLDEEYEEDEEYESDEEYEEEYEKNCASWYDLSDDRQNELKEEFYSKTGKKVESVFLLSLCWMFTGSCLGGISCAWVNDGIFYESFGRFMSGFEILFYILLCGFILAIINAIIINASNKKTNEAFSSWLKHSKGIYKSKE